MITALNQMAKEDEGAVRVRGLELFGNYLVKHNFTRYDIENLLSLFKDKNVSVKKAALQILSSLGQAKPNAVGYICKELRQISLHSVLLWKLLSNLWNRVLALP